MMAFAAHKPALLAVIALALATAVLPASSARAQQSGITIMTDKSRYQIGETAQVCYTVAGPGPVTITDTLADGSSQAFYSAYDDGTGYCQSGAVTPPAGTECLRIESTSSGGSGSSQTCFEVAGVPDCGQVSVLGPTGGSAANSGSQAAEDCFYQAYQVCTPATLEVSISGVDAGIRYTFGLLNGGQSCVITDSYQHFVVPRPPQPASSTTCSSLSRTREGGLQFSNCGEGDVIVPPGS